MTWIELIAVTFGFLCVLLTIFQSIWCWPTGLVQVTLFIVIFYDAKLYSDLILHVIYVFLQIYGWYVWQRGSSTRSTLPVTHLVLSSRIVWIAVVIAGTVALGFVMSEYTDAALPYGDAFTTVASLVAQWLLAKKKVESWAFWIVVDLVAINIYVQKGLFFTCGLYAAFLIMAILGWIAWQRSLRTSWKVA